MLAVWLVFFPESPKFLIECGEADEALDILKNIYQQNTGNNAEEYPVRFELFPKKHQPITELLISLPSAQTDQIAAGERED